MGLFFCRALALLSGNASLGSELNCSGFWKEAWLCPSLTSAPAHTSGLSLTSKPMWNKPSKNISVNILWLWLKAES